MNQPARVPASPKLKRRDFITYAFLSQGIYGSDDRLAGLLPLFQPIVESLAGEFFNPKLLAERVNNAYPWSINADIAENLIPRFKAAGWLEEIMSHDGDAAYRYVAPASAGLPGDAVAAAETELSELGIAFEAFVQDLSPLFSVAYQREKLEDLLLSWMVEKRAFDREMLIQAVRQEGNDAPFSKDDLSADDINYDGIFKTEENYLCARFVEYLSVSDDAMFEKVVRLAAVSLVTEVILDAQQPYVIGFSFKSGRIFYDAPFLMDCLECSGNERYLNAIYIHQHLIRFEATPSVFSHSLEEAKDNLRAVLRAQPHERHGPTAEAIRRGEVVEEYARDVLGRTKSYLEKKNIQQVDFDPLLFSNEHTYFSIDHTENLIGRIRWDNIVARERDALSVTYVMRKRRGRQSANIAEATPFLLTRNAPLCDIALRFCRERQLLAEGEIGPAIHQRQISSIIWLLVGSEERRELARRDLIQRCADVARCRPDVVNRTREQLRRMDLDKSRQFEALISRPRATQLLMDLTLGAQRVITSENIETIFERLRESAAEDVRRKADETIRELKQRHRTERRMLHERLAAAEKRISATEASAKVEHKRIQEMARKTTEHSLALQCQFQEIQERDHAILEAWISAAEARTNKLDRGIHYTLYAALGICALLSAYFLLTETSHWLAKLASSSVTVLGALIAIAEKFELGPAVADTYLFRKKVEFIEARAREANREDLLTLLIRDTKERRLGTKRRIQDAGTAAD